MKGNFNFDNRLNFNSWDFFFKVIRKKFKGVLNLFIFYFFFLIIFDCNKFIYSINIDTQQTYKHNLNISNNLTSFSIIEKMNRLPDINEFYSHIFLFDDPDNFNINPKTGTINTGYKIHIKYPCSSYPININLDLDIFDPISEMELMIFSDYLAVNLNNCNENINKFNLPPIPEKIITKLKTDYVILNYSLKLKNSKGTIEYFSQIGNKYFLKKKDNIIPFDIKNNPVKDNKEKIENYEKMNFIEKKDILNNTLKNLTKENDKDENLQISILISEYLLSTNCDSNLLYEEFNINNNIHNYKHLIDSYLAKHLIENKNELSSKNSNDYSLKNFKEDDYNKLYFSLYLEEECNNTLIRTLEKSMKNLIENFQCENVENIIFNQSNPNNTILLAALSVLYPSIKNFYFSENSFANHFTMSNCLSIYGLNLLRKLNSTYHNDIDDLSNEFMESIFLTASNVLDTLSNNTNFNNKSYNEEFSLIINDETIKTKNLIETQEKLFINNNFNNKSKIKSNNLIYFYEKIKKNESNQQILMLKQNYPNSIYKQENNQSIFYKNFSLKYEISDTDIIISIPIDYILEKYKLKEIYVSAINYKNFPLLKNINKTYSDDVVSIKIFDAIKNEVVEIENLDDDFPIKIYLNKTDKNNLNLNTCLFYDDELKIWNDYKCKRTSESSSDYIICDCYHLTEFSFSIINPVDIYKDLIAILRDIRFINNLSDFKYFNFSNGGVLYMFLAFLLILLIGLYFILKEEIKEKKYDNLNKEKNLDLFIEDELYLYYDDDEIIVKKFFNKEVMKRNLKINIKKFDKKCYLNSSKNDDLNSDMTNNENLEIHRNLLEENKFMNKSLPNEKIIDSYDNQTNDNLKISTNINNINEITNSIGIIGKINNNKKTINFGKELYYAFLVISNEYRIFALFSNDPFIMNKYSILFILFFDIINYFAISSLISPNNSFSGDPKRTSYGYIYVDKKIAIYFLIILFSKIPRILLTKFVRRLLIDKNTDKDLKKQKRFYIYCATYMLIIFVFIFFLINTLWISMNNVKHKRTNNFIYNFIFSYLLKYVWIFIFIFIKSVLFYFLKRYDNTHINNLYLLTLNIYTFIP